jgi:hypothetical protein
LNSIPRVVSTALTLTESTVLSRSAGGHGALAGGGPAEAGQAYTVGEHGPETLVMGSASGTVIPNGAGGGTHYHFHIGNVISSAHDREQFVNMLLREARFRPGT